MSSSWLRFDVDGGSTPSSMTIAIPDLREVTILVRCAAARIRCYTPGQTDGPVPA
jgi:hypothetical protein